MTLIECAWAATRKKDSHLQAQLTHKTWREERARQPCRAPQEHLANTAYIALGSERLFIVSTVKAIPPG